MSDIRGTVISPHKSKRIFFSHSAERCTVYMDESLTLHLSVYVTAQAEVCHEKKLKKTKHVDKPLCPSVGFTAEVDIFS